MEWLLQETGILALGQLTPSIVTIALAKLKSEGRSDQTILHYVAASKAFSRWLETNRRTRFDLLKDLKRPKVVDDQKRPALTPAQTTKLITATQSSRTHSEMSGIDRSWLYTLAACTGFRRAELRPSSLGPSI